MSIGLIFLEISIAALLIGGIASHKRSMGERVLMLATVPVAYLFAFLIIKLGAFDGIGRAVGAMITDAIAFRESAAALALIVSIVNFIIRIFLMVILFWLLLFALRLTLKIVLRKTKAAEKSTFFLPNEKFRSGKGLATCAIGAVCAFLVCTLSLFPLMAIENLLEPAVKKAQDADHAGTLVQEYATVADDYVVDTVIDRVHKYTGMQAIMRATARSLGASTMVTNRGELIEYNVNDMLQTLLCDGVDGEAMYEYVCQPSRHTLKDVAMLSGVIEDIADSPALLAVAGEWMASNLSGTAPAEDADLTDKLLDKVVGTYAEADVATMANDLHALSTLLSTLTTDLGDVSLRTEALTEELMTYLSDEDSAYKLVHTMAKMGLYSESISLLTEFMLDILCDTLGVPADAAAYNESFRHELLRVLNERGEGTYDIDQAEKFIVYMMVNEMAEGEYRIENPTAYTELDTAYISYTRYFTRLDHIADVFADFALAKEDTAVFYVMQGDNDYQGKLLYRRNGAWYVCTDEDEINHASFVASYLLHRSNTHLVEDPTYNFKDEEITAYAERLLTSLQGSRYFLSDALLADTKALALALSDPSAFAPADKIYRADIKGAVRTDAVMNEGDDRAFAKMLSTAAGFAAMLGDGATDTTALVLANFGTVGRLLDAMHAFQMTSEVPDLILMATTQSADFGDYLGADSVRTLVDAVREGDSTYEALFTSVQSFYNMINQIIPVQ